VQGIALDIGEEVFEVAGGTSDVGVNG
jgi:hypothetical protein